jgi:ribosomal protein L37AE/L43A
MKYTCPNCRKIINIVDKYSSKTDVCPHCMKPFDLRAPLLDWKTGFRKKSDNPPKR